MEIVWTTFKAKKHYFQVLINGILIYIYIPLKKVKICVRFKMLYRTSSDMYSLHLLLLHKPSCGDQDNLRYNSAHGGKLLVCTSYQQSAIAHGIVDSIDDITLTFQDMCNNGTGANAGVIL
jgi:hypothetical protein